MLQNNFQSASETDVARNMGGGFAESVMELQAGQWHGPIFSGYGVHLVYVSDKQKSPPAAFEDVKAIVLENWQIEKRVQFNADFLESLKSRYEIVLDEIPAERILVKPDETSMVNETTEVPAS